MQLIVQRELCSFCAWKGNSYTGKIMLLPCIVDASISLCLVKDSRRHHLRAPIMILGCKATIKFPGKSLSNE